jgi:putative transposase
VSERHVAESMRDLGLRARAARRYMATTNSNHALLVSPNLLKQDFTADAINRKWVGDITYLWTAEGWLYLATMIDVYSRAVIGCSLASEMTAELACSALRMALTARGNPTGVIVHSDRGSQCRSYAYRDIIAAAQLRGSMSVKGNCYDNAMAESFFHSRKVEDIHGR